MDNIVTHPIEDGGHMHPGEEVDSQFVTARGGAAVAFEPAEKVLHRKPHFVKAAVEGAFAFPVGFGGEAMADRRK